MLLKYEKGGRIYSTRDLLIDKIAPSLNWSSDSSHEPIMDTTEEGPNTMEDRKSALSQVQ